MIGVALVAGGALALGLAAPVLGLAWTPQGTGRPTGLADQGRLCGALEIPARTRLVAGGASRRSPTEFPDFNAPREIGRKYLILWWAVRDSNPQPRDYESWFCLIFHNTPPLRRE